MSVMVLVGIVPLRANLIKEIREIYVLYKAKRGIKDEELRGKQKSMRKPLMGSYGKDFE